MSDLQHSIRASLSLAPPLLVWCLLFDIPTAPQLGLIGTHANRPLHDMGTEELVVVSDIIFGLLLFFIEMQHTNLSLCTQLL